MSHTVSGIYYYYLTRPEAQSCVYRLGSYRPRDHSDRSLSRSASRISESKTMAELRSRLTETEIRISQNLPSYDDSRVMTSSVMMSSMTSSSTASESRSLCSDAEADQFCQKVQIRNNQVEKILK